MTKIWNDIIELVESRFVDKDNDDVLRYSEDGESLATAIQNLLEASDCTQYTVDDDTIFESCGYDTGVVYAAWIEKDGKLQMITYQWESR